MSYAVAGQRCAMDRVLTLASSATVSTRSGPHWLAVRSGASSNDLNAVLSKPGFVPDRALLNELRRWWDGALASWLVEEPNEALTRVLVNDGWTPERSGRWCGRLLHHGPHVRAASGPKDMTVVRVATDDDLEQWLDVASACGWFEGRHDRMTRRDLMRGAAGDPLGASWLARLVDRPVGMVRGWVSGPYVEIVDVAVRHSAQRRGVGTALVSSVLAWGATKGAREVVAAPSPDGWSLFDALAFTNVPVTPDVCFYWSGEGGSPNRS